MVGSRPVNLQIRTVDLLDDFKISLTRKTSYNTIILELMKTYTYFGRNKALFTEQVHDALKRRMIYYFIRDLDEWEFIPSDLDRLEFQNIMLMMLKGKWADILDMIRERAVRQRTVELKTHKATKGMKKLASKVGEKLLEIYEEETLHDKKKAKGN